MLIEHALDEFFERGDGFSFAEDDLGVAAAALAVEIELDFGEVGGFGSGQLAEEDVERDFTRASCSARRVRLSALMAELYRTSSRNTGQARPLNSLLSEREQSAKEFTSIGL